MKKRLLYLPVLVLAAVLIVRVVMLVTRDSGGGPQGFSRPPVAVEVDSVRVGPIREIREFTGSVLPQYRYIIAPKVSGRVIELRKRIGDPIRRGEVVARIDDAEYQQDVREAEANLRSTQASVAEAKSQLSLAAQDLERVQSLQQKGIASPSELDAATTNHEAQQSRLELAQAQVEQRQAALKSAEIRLAYTVLVAPEPGFTGERFVDEGALLSPNSPVVSVIGIDRVIIQTTIIERDYGLVHVGQQAEVTVDAFPTKIFTGQVARIAPMLQEASRMAQMEIEVVNDSLVLKPGMFTSVRVVLAENDSAQTVPGRAVVTRDGGKGVFVVNRAEPIARYVPVEIGITTPDRTEIITPEIHDLVVTLGQHLLADGSPVILPRPTGAPGSETGS